ncbi:tRNA wybutosine-synthesizing protein 2-like protein [Camelus dromedarius]|uniref:tRNA wybutosine-synthesizing protein 2-like protein n=1 Tax=Camelus dromedarius TaxID=9838 RepID=A0A5N4C3L1_CAMDR|nr:tRNA wybutosine-synthesizing protein 2-like protein [Camelus dromedarius]
MRKESRGILERGAQRQGADIAEEMGSKMKTEGGTSDAVVGIMIELQLTEQYRVRVKQAKTFKIVRAQRLGFFLLAIGQTSKAQNPVPSKEVQDCSPAQRLFYEICCLVADQGVRWSAELKEDFPCSWQWLADLLLLNEDCFQAKHWGKKPELWETIAWAYGIQGLAK